MTATAAPDTVVGHADVAAALAERPDRPLVLVDLAVPRDVDPAVGRLPGVRLFDVDDLRGGLDAAAAGRAREVPRVETIVAEETARFSRRCRELDVEPFVSDLLRRADATREREREPTLRPLGDLHPDASQHLRRSASRSSTSSPRADCAAARERAEGRRASARVPRAVRLAQRGS